MKKINRKTISVVFVVLCIASLYGAKAISQDRRIVQKQIKTSTASDSSPFSQGIEVNGLVFLSGTLGVDASTGKLAGDEVVAQLEQIVKNISEVLKEAGCAISDVIKTTVYLTDMRQYAAMNEVYMRLFQAPYPARTCVEISALPVAGALIEVEVVAVKP
jgi:endoribonuclease L-PSP, putative